jgi:peptidyl-tRNA hydrolase|tara:strand:+ start:579 stop:1094 length:516 start_codon:yes stop_codon:yes gene_type:complete
MAQAARLTAVANRLTCRAVHIHSVRSRAPARRTLIRTMATDAAAAPANPIVQYVVIRRDLGQGMGWPLGSICAQAAHAAVAAVWEHKDHPDTAAYCAPDAIDGMHKVVLEVKGETQLVNLAKKLEDAGVDHRIWTEQPEDYPTCLATRPYRKDEVSALFKKCNLAKGLIAQ